MIVVTDRKPSNVNGFTVVMKYCGPGYHINLFNEVSMAINSHSMSVN
jgi:hypothetical protein